MIPRLAPADFDFGNPEAQYDSELLSYFVANECINEILEERPHLVVGARGSGKSALRKFLAGDRKSLSIEISLDNRITVGDVSSNDVTDLAERFELTLSMVIASTLLESGELTGPVKSRLDSALNELSGDPKSPVANILGRLRNTAGRTRVAAGVPGIGAVQLDFSPLFERRAATRPVSSHVAALATPLLAALDKHPVRLLVDDADGVIRGGKSAPVLTEALLYAVRKMDSKLGPGFWPVLFVQLAMFESLFWNAYDYPQSAAATRHFKWTKDELCEVIGERLRVKANARRSRPASQYWSLAFEGSETQLGDLITYLIERVTHGPRDLVLFCEQSRQRAARKGHPRITFDDITDVEYDYSKLKLAAVNSVFRRSNKEKEGDLKRVLEEFTDTEQVWQGSELRKKLDEIVTGTLRDQVPWLKDKTGPTLLDELYGTGFLGFEGDGDDFVYVWSMPRPESLLRKSSRYKIHAAFNAVLQLSH